MNTVLQKCNVHAQLSHLIQVVKKNKHHHHHSKKKKKPPNQKTKKPTKTTLVLGRISHRTKSDLELFHTMKPVYTRFTVYLEDYATDSAKLTIYLKIRPKTLSTQSPHVNPFLKTR